MMTETDTYITSQGMPPTYNTDFPRNLPFPLHKLANLVRVSLRLGHVRFDNGSVLLKILIDMFLYVSCRLIMIHFYTKWKN